MMEAKRLIGLATQWLLARVLRYDLMLLTIVMCLITVGFITLFSAGYSFPWRIEDQMRNIIVALTAMFMAGYWRSYSTLRDHEACCPHDACMVLLETC